MSKEEKKVKVISYEVAKKDVQRWLDFKRVDEKKQDESESQIESMVSAVMNGHLSIDNECVITQVLKHPSENGPKELKYKPRIKVSDVDRYSKKLDMAKYSDILVANICASTETASGIIKDMDKEDFRYAQDICLFFV